MFELENLEYTLVALEGVAEEDHNPSLLHDYWFFAEEGGRWHGYIHPVTQLQKKYGIKSQGRIETVVKKMVIYRLREN